MRWILAWVFVLFATAASTQSLTGVWVCVEKCPFFGARGFILQEGWDLRVISPTGNRSRAWTEGDHHLWLDDARLGATYSNDAILFENGMLWHRPWWRRRW